MNERMILERAYEVGLHINFHVQARSLRGADLGFPDFIIAEYCATIDGFMPIEIPHGKAQKMNVIFLSDRIEMTLYLDDGVAYRVIIPYAFIAAIQTVHGVQEWPPDPKAQLVPC